MKNATDTAHFILHCPFLIFKKFVFENISKLFPERVPNVHVFKITEFAIKLYLKPEEKEEI